MRNTIQMRCLPRNYERMCRVVPEVTIAAKRKVLLAIASEIYQKFYASETDMEGRERTLDIEFPGGTLSFSNEDMENRPDLTEDTVLVEYQRD